MTISATFKGAEGQLHAAASAATGFSDFGDAAEYLPGLQRLLAALDENGPVFNTQGRAFAWNLLVGVLISRLFSEQGWKAHPHCLQQPVRRPLIVIGIPRTGTTALHKLLSMDPQFQGMERWLTAFPMPRPERESWVDNPWYQACEAGLEQFFAAAPHMRAAHDMRADDVDECLEVLKQNFCSNFFGSSLRVPDYDRWWLQQSEASSYQRLLKVIQLIGANSPQKTWLLKNPGHVAQVDALLDVFPDACVVQTHRSPASALPSLCSVLREARSILEEGVDAQAIGQRETRYWQAAVDDAHRARTRAPGQFLDVLQSDIQREPMAVVQNIYQHFGLTLGDEARARMLERISAAPEARHGEHRYSAQTFGLDAAGINQHFASYIQRYALA
jgi:hypothetical protein